MPSAQSDNWFERVAQEAENTDVAKKARQRALDRASQAAAEAAREKKKAEALSTALSASVKSVEEIKDAFEAFKKVASGAAPMVGTGPTTTPKYATGGYVTAPRPGSDAKEAPYRRPVMSQESVVEYVVQNIQAARDVDEAWRIGSEWITTITNAATAAMRERDTPSE